jgi:hypothetical protein
VTVTLEDLRAGLAWLVAALVLGAAHLVATAPKHRKDKPQP